jgi:hypothetical protein
VAEGLVLGADSDGSRAPLYRAPRRDARSPDPCRGSDSVVLVCTYGAKSANADGWSGDHSMKVCEVECRTGITLIKQDMEKAALHRAALVMHKPQSISVRAAPGSIVCGSERSGTD